ncbi:MAG TPA: hypothetical protein VGN18_18160 [Jatrophihabitans sp.]|jgi:hypothetical protein|uniref:hypothetical protein n=1 Tax=Jatrophihabitans sp. TaxID=1932789 RepID=UPI002E025310|nr:hypothetical protein [Jatrophihabitans sp.]
MDTVDRHRTTSPSPAVAAAEQRLYDAETALHAARQSGVDAWVAAAYDRLHETILEHDAVRSR